jgi:hypothetical protein
MFAYRKAHIIKHGQMQKALELLTNESKRITLARPLVRIYTPSISPNVLVLEMDSETEEAYDAFWAAYSKDEGAAPFWEEWLKILERKLSDERWKVTEL